MKQIYKSFGVGLFLLSTNLVASSLNSIGINLGNSHTGYSQIDTKGTTTLGNEPDTLYKTIELYLALQDTHYENIKHYLSFNYGYNDELKHQYILGGINRYFENFYVGVLIGYGELTWKYDPINNAKDKNYNANSILAGIQIGYDIPLSNSISLGLNSKVLFHNYETTIEPTNEISSQITHNYTANVGVGIKYSF